MLDKEIYYVLNTYISHINLDYCIKPAFFVFLSCRVSNRRQTDVLPAQVKVSTDPAGGSCSGPSSRRRNIPPELEGKALQGTESNRRTEPGHPAPWTSCGGSSGDQRRVR